MPNVKILSFVFRNGIFWRYYCNALGYEYIEIALPTLTKNFASKILNSNGIVHILNWKLKSLKSKVGNTDTGSISSSYCLEERGLEVVLDKRLRNRSRPRRMFRVAEDRVVCSGAGVVFSTCWPRFKLNRDLLPNKVERLGVGSDEGVFVLDVEDVDEGLKWGMGYC